MVSPSTALMASETEPSPPAAIRISTCLACLSRQCRNSSTESLSNPSIEQSPPRISLTCSSISRFSSASVPPATGLTTIPYRMAEILSKTTCMRRIRDLSEPDPFNAIAIPLYNLRHFAYRSQYAGYVDLVNRVARPNSFGLSFGW